MLEPRIYPADERPSVEVLVDGEWVRGELREWFPTDLGWHGNIQYSTGVSPAHIGTFSGEHIREVGST